MYITKKSEMKQIEILMDIFINGEIIIDFHPINIQVIEILTKYHIAHGYLKSLQNLLILLGERQRLGIQKHQRVLTYGDEVAILVLLMVYEVIGQIESDLVPEIFIFQVRRIGMIFIEYGVMLHKS